MDQITVEATTCSVSASDIQSSTRSIFHVERKLLHTLEDIVQPHVGQESDTVGNDDNHEARREVARYSGDKDFGDSWIDHGPLEW